MGDVLVVIDGRGWALDTLYSPLAILPGITVMSIAEMEAAGGLDCLHDARLVHFTYWEHYLNMHVECQRAVVTIHHLIRERVDAVMDRLVAEPPDALIVSDSHRLCQFGEMGLPIRLIPFGIDKQRHRSRTLRHDRFTVGWLGKEWDTKRYKRFDSIKAAAEMAGIAYVDGGHIIGQPMRYEHTDDFYAAIDAFVVASYIDAGPMPALEALSRGIPVLATPTGMMPRVIQPGENGYFHDGTVRGMAAVMQEARRTLHRHVSHAMVPTLADWTLAHGILYGDILGSVQVAA